MKRLPFVHLLSSIVPLLLVMQSALVARATPPTGTGYKITSTIPLGDGDDRWDYLTFDPKTHRLFVSRQTHVQVVDVGSGKIVGTIPATEGVHGIALAAELNRGFTSNGKAGTVTAFDATTLAHIADVKTTGENPDAIVYDDATKLVFAMNGRGKNVTAIDAAGLSVKGTVALDGKPEFAALDGGRLFVNLEDKGELVAVDTNRLVVAARWPLPGCEEPGGLAVDRKSHRLFVGCGNQVMAIVDDTTGKVVQTLKSGDHTDAVSFNNRTRTAFASNGDGTLTVVKESGPDHYDLVENASTQKGARTMALDEETGTIFLVTADFQAPAAPTAAQPHPRPSIVSGSCRVIVATPSK